MEDNQPTGTLDQVLNRSDEVTITIEEDNNSIYEEVDIQEELIPTLQNLEQTNHEENNISEESKTEEIKDDEQEETTSAQLNKQILNIESLLNNCAQTNETIEKQKEEKISEFIRQMKSSSLFENFKGKEHEIFPERMLNANKIFNKIKNSLENLKCCYQDCQQKAVLINSDGNIDKIFCRVHENETKNSTDAIIFENEVNKCKPVLQALEKKLLFLQVKMIIIKSQNKEENLYENILEDLERKLCDIKNIIITMKKKTKSLTELFNTEKNKTERKFSKYISLSFIKDDCEKCLKFIHEILLRIFETTMDREIELLIYILYNASKGIELNEESKFNTYIEVPYEIYGK